MRVTLAHDSFTQRGGAERVIQAFHELFPNSPIYTLAVDPALKTMFNGWDIRTSFLQAFYRHYRKLQHLFFLAPVAVKLLPQINDDVLLSSSSSFIKGLRTHPGVVHVNYCHTPTRFLWTDREYAKAEVMPLLRPAAEIFFKWLRRWDKRAAQRVTHFIANSREVQKRIKLIYGRDSEIIYPFVDTSFWQPTAKKDNYFLLAGRLQPYKQGEFIVSLFNELGWELHVCGTGRQEKYLRSIARQNIKFFGPVSDEHLRDEYSGARAFLFPQFEDFGLMPLEAAACGTPTLGYGKGGSLETIIPGVTGELFTDFHNVKAILTTWTDNKYSVESLRQHAAKFDKALFKRRIKEFIERVYNERSR